MMKGKLYFGVITPQMSKKKTNDRIIVKAKMNFPFEYYVGITGILIVVLIILKEMLFEDEKFNLEWFAVLLFSIVCFAFIFLMAGHQYKELTVFTDRIRIKKLFNPFIQTLAFHDIKGFEQFETFGRNEIQFWIRIIKSDGRKIALVRDNYSNYDKIFIGLQKSGITYLGRREMKIKYRGLYEFVLKWSAILFPFVYGLFLLMKAKNL